MGNRPAASLLIRIDPRGQLQHQIYAGIRRAILDGTLSPGSRLPSSRAMAIDLGVSRTTTVLAYDQLLAEGYLAGRRGSGTFVARELPGDLMRTRAPRPTLSLMHATMSNRGTALAATPPTARRIGEAPRAFRIGVPPVDVFPIRLWSRLVSRRVRSLTPSQLDYGESAGVRRLRDAIADHVRSSRGAQCDASDIIIVAGAQRGLEMVCRLLLDPGDEAWLEEPGYPGTRSALVAAGARIVPVPVDGEGLDVEAGVRLGSKARVAYVTPSHQFPLGVPMSLPRRLALLKWASAARAWVIEDDYDSEFRFGMRAIPSLHGLDADGRVLYIGSFSKTVFPALRLGFVIVPPELRERVLAVRRATDLHPPVLEQSVLADFIIEGHYDRHLRRMRAVCAERLQALVAEAERQCRGALKIRPVSTGMHAVADLDGVDAERVFRGAADGGVEVMPLSAYFLGAPRAANALMMGFACVPPGEMRGGMERLAQAIEGARRPLRLRTSARAVANEGR
jgi:GntR family transcriptional regulator / MocR family aminotransferase